MVHLNPHNLTMAIGQRFVRILARRSELVSAHHLGSAGDDRGHVPITQLGEGTHLHLHLRPRGGGGETRLFRQRSLPRMQPRLETTIERWEDKRSFTYVRRLAPRPAIISSRVCISYFATAIKAGLRSR